MPTNQGTPTLEDALQIFLLDGRSRRLSVHTTDWYKQRLGWFLAWLAERNVTDVEDVTANDIRKYLAELDRRKLSGWTIHGCARCIKAFFNFCVEETWIEVSPMKRVRMPKLDDDILPALEAEDVHKLLKAATYERDQAIVLCLLDTGCRASELLAWTGADIDTATGAVRVKGKRRERHVYLGNHSLKQLLRYFIERGKPKPYEEVWLSLHGNTPLTYNGLRLMLTRLGEAAGVEHCTAHTFRRTFALWSLRSGMSIYELQRLMGHADITVLKRYLALVETDIANAHKLHGAVDNILLPNKRKRRKPR